MEKFWTIESSLKLYRSDGVRCYHVPVTWLSAEKNVAWIKLSPVVYFNPVDFKQAVNHHPFSFKTKTKNIVKLHHDESSAFEYLSYWGANLYLLRKNAFFRVTQLILRFWKESAVSEETVQQYRHAGKGLLIAYTLL